MMAGDTIGLTVYATSRFDDRVMEFVLMKLEFPEEGEPRFSELATFKTIGVVMNVFLLDPSSRLLSAFVWVASSNTIGLYALLDWDKEEYVFIDTTIECVRPLSYFHARLSDCVYRSQCPRTGHVFSTRSRS